MDERSDDGDAEVYLGPEISPDGTRVGLHREGDNVVPMRFRPALDGETAPPGADLVMLGDSCGCGTWRKATTIYTGRAGTSKGTKGPTQVATDTYRSNYDTIFGKKMPVGDA